MNPRISIALAGMLLAAFGLFATAPQTQPKPNPSQAARMNNLGAAYMNQQLFEKALKSFQQAAELDPKLAIARLNEGVAFLNLQKIDEAKAALEDALKQDPKNPQAWYNLGLYAKNTGDAQSAIDAFRHVSEIDPSVADTWYFLGSAYVQPKQFPQAIEAFQHALQLNPIHASAEFGLSRAYQQSGDVDHAREHLKKFQYITQNKIGAPMSLAYGEQGQYSRAVESPSAVLKAPAPIKVRFVNVTAQAGIVLGATTNEKMGGDGGLGAGGCFIDYDGDGKLDVFLSDMGARGGIGLYRNLGGGRFEDVTQKAGLDPDMHAVGCTAGDYDNDGMTDLAFTSGGRIFLLHNEKDGRFKDVTQSAGIKHDDLAIGLTFIDYDHDGDLDLYVTRALNKAPQPPHGYSAVEGTGWGEMRRNDGNGTFTEVTESLGLSGIGVSFGAVGTDYNNDRAIDLVATGLGAGTIFENPREGKFPARRPWPNGGAAVHYDKDGWVDLVAVGETKDGKGEVRLFRNLGADGFKDVTVDVGLDKIQLKEPRAVITGDYDGDGATDLLITQNHGPAVLLRNEGGNQNHWLRLSLKGLADNKSAIGTKVEVLAGGNLQTFEIAGSSGYLGQNSPYLTVGLGDAKEADVVRMLWPSDVLQDEINVAGDKQQDFLEIVRRGSSCPTLFVWNGKRYEFVADMLGAGVVGHWIGPDQRDIPRPVEYVKIDRNAVHEKGDK